jgi:hypothetical protein
VVVVIVVVVLVNASVVVVSGGRNVKSVIGVNCAVGIIRESLGNH